MSNPDQQCARREKFKSRQLDDSIKQTIIKEEGGSSTSANEEAETVVDDPCWGGPQHDRHNLSYLLSRIESNASVGGHTTTGADDDDVTAGNVHASEPAALPPLILHECDSYLVLNKPPDLRMDGPHAATVHKLLTFWYPSPALEEMAREIASNAESVSYREALLERIAKLSKHNDLIDNQIRPCHQLDYATSGILLVARTRKAAGIACRAFRSRRAEKEYVAVVHGHIDRSDSSKKNNTTPETSTSTEVSPGEEETGTPFVIPTLPEERLRHWEDGSEEDRYRRARVNSKKDTFAGYLPPHAVFVRWKNRTAHRRRGGWIDETKERTTTSEGSTAFHHEGKRPPASGITGEDAKEQALACSSLSSEEEQDIVTMTWSDVKKNVRWKQIFQNMAKRYNDARRSEMLAAHDPSTNNSSTDGINVDVGAFHDGIMSPRSLQSKSRDTNSHARRTKLPPIFRIEGENDENDAFYINASIAELPDDFRMVVDPRALFHHERSHREHYASFFGECSAKQLDFKPSLTRCVVLWRGELNGKPVTKVRLQPRTGRRHQLRLHMVVIGHPILGDVTYEHPPDGNAGAHLTKKSRCEGEQVREEQEYCARMCLHARALSIPLINGIVQTFTAPDPFRIARDGAGGGEVLNVLEV